MLLLLLGWVVNLYLKQLINEINDMHIDGLPRVDKLNALVGKYVNLEYTLPNGQKVKFLDDQKTYQGNQLESEFGGDRCFGILAVDRNGVI